MARIVVVLAAAGLLFAIAAARLGSGPAAAPAMPSRAESPATGRLDEIARLREHGLTDHEARQLAFAQLEEAALRNIDNPWNEYWRGASPPMSYAQRLQSAYALLRLELERRFGAGASRMSEFARAFRPLDAELGFLSSEEQIEIAARRLQAQAGAIAGSALAVTAPAASLPNRGAIELEFLAPAAALEVRLRASPLADQLRRAGVDLNEEEFRSAFALLDGSEAGDLKAYVAARRSLRKLLGDERYVRVIAQRDPQYQVVARIGRERGLDETTVAAAYEAFASAQESLLELAAGGGALVDAEAVAQKEREQLAAAVGEEAATAMLEARAELRLSLARSGNVMRAER